MLATFDLYYCPKCAYFTDSTHLTQNLNCPHCKTESFIKVENPEYYLKKYIRNFDITRPALAQYLENPDFNRAMENALIFSKPNSKFSIEAYNARLSKQKTAIQQYNDSYAPKENNPLSCPKCGCTSITTGQRGYNIVWGYFGSSQTMNRCASCGYQWRPQGNG